MFRRVFIFATLLWPAHADDSLIKMKLDVFIKNERQAQIKLISNKKFAYYVDSVLTDTAYFHDSYNRKVKIKISEIIEVKDYTKEFGKYMLKVSGIVALIGVTTYFIMAYFIINAFEGR